MAKATKVIEEVETVVKTKEERVNLSLTMVEARTLLVLLRNIGGDPNESARKYCDNIRRSLEEVGIIVIDTWKFLEDENRTIYFKHGSDKLV
jgi:hypothetical protein